MPRREDARTEIMDAAERMIRVRGYHAFSFRDIAEVVGVKSASIHYHFPTKEDLGVAVIERYRERIQVFLHETSDVAHADSPLSPLSQVFQGSFDDGLMCLCGILGAEHQSLPTRMIEAVRAFFEMAKSWSRDRLVAAGMPPERAEERAIQVVSTLEGALMLACTLDDRTILDTACALAGSRT